MSFFKNSQDIIYAKKICQARAGDKIAYEQLLKSIMPILGAFIRNKIGNRADNEDILQEILLAIHSSSHTYNTERSFTNWMFAIASYKVTDFLRKTYRKKSLIEVDFEKVQNCITYDVTKDTPPNESLTELLNILPERQRKILHLMKIEGHSVKQIAILMKMSVSAVKVSAHRAYKVLINHKNNRDFNDKE